MGSNTHFKSAFKQLFIQGRPTQKGSNWAAKTSAARDVMKEVKRDPVGGWLSKRPGSVWMFKSLSAKSSRAQIQSVQRCNPLVASWALMWTNQAAIPDSRAGEGEGKLVPAFLVKNFNVILFLWKKWESFSHLSPSPKGLLLAFPPLGARPWLPEGCRAVKTLSVVVGQVALRWTREKNPFGSAEWVLCIPSFSCDNLHLRAKKKMARKNGLPFFCGTPSYRGG